MTPQASLPSADQPSHPASVETPATAPAPAWVPIRSLSAKHRGEILAHLTALSARDRYLRFGYNASDGQLARYVDGINFSRDEVFGIFNRRLTLIALGHLACPDIGQAGNPTAEFGGSVAEHARGRGYGARLFEHAMLHARNRGLSKLFIHALSENTAMLKIVRHAGAVVERSGSESDAYLKLPEDTVASQVEQWVGQQAAAMDYRFKHQAQWVDGFLGACRTWVVDSEKRPEPGQFLPDLQAHSPAMAQKPSEKWPAEAVSQQPIPKSDRLLDTIGEVTANIGKLAKPSVKN